MKKFNKKIISSLFLLAFYCLSLWHCPTMIDPDMPDAPDLAVSLSQNKNSVLAMGAVTLMAVVTNAGDGASDQATLRWYRSADGSLDTNDTEIGTDMLSSLAAGASTTISRSITAPNVSGTYYYFACVDGADTKSTAANCSTAISVVVRDAADLVITLRSDKSYALPSESVILMAIISNAGAARAAGITLHWYRSADSNLDKSSDTLLRSNTVTGLGVGASIKLSTNITTASTSSTNTYFAYVDQVSNEVDTADNLSSILLLAVPRTTYLPGLDFNTLDDAENDNPFGLWSDGTTMWVGDNGFTRTKIYAYDLATKARNSSEDFNTLVAAGNLTCRGIWSDGTTMWVIDSEDRKIYAYSLSTKARNTNEEFNTLAAGNRSPQDLWSDGTTMWVADNLRGTNSKLYAYKMSDKTRDSAKDFDTLNDAGNTFARGLWSDGTTMWVLDFDDDRLYAYKMSDKTRDSAKDFDTLNAENQHPGPIWSDGTIMWVADTTDIKIYAYKK